MKPAEARRLASERTMADLDQACAELAEERPPFFEIAGADAGEQLTHVLLAKRIRERMDAHGEDLKDAYRHVMAGVRDVLTND